MNVSCMEAPPISNTPNVLMVAAAEGGAALRSAALLPADVVDVALPLAAARA